MRYFTIESIKTDKKSLHLKRKVKRNDQGVGRYKGASPMNAAKKVASRAYREIKGIATKKITVTIFETTRGADKSKLHSYTFKKKKLKEPVGPFNSTFTIDRVK